MAGALRSRAWRSFRWTRQSVTVLVCQSVSWSVFSDRRVSTQSKGQEKERLSWSLREIDQQVQQRQQHMHRLLHNVGTVHSGKLQSDNDGDTQVSPLPLPAPLPLPSAPSNYRRNCKCKLWMNGLAAVWLGLGSFWAGGDVSQSKQTGHGSSPICSVVLAMCLTLLTKVKGNRCGVRCSSTSGQLKYNLEFHWLINWLSERVNTVDSSKLWLPSLILPPNLLMVVVVVEIKLLECVSIKIAIAE